MKSLMFLCNFAVLQAKHGGVGGYVRVIDIQRDSSLPRATVYRYINSLIEIGVLQKLGYGKYALSTHACMRAIGYCTVTPIDVISYRTNILMQEEVML